MAGPFNSSREKRRPTINITPLIDVMFLLLIFFMVSSTFRDNLGIDLSLAHADSATEQDLSSHTVTVDKAGNYYVGEVLLDKAGLRAVLAEAHGTDPETTLVVRADRSVALESVVDVLDIARDLGYERVALPTAYSAREEEAR